MKTILKSQDRRTEVGYKTFMYVCFSPNGNAETCKHNVWWVWSEGVMCVCVWGGAKFEEHKFTFTLNCISSLV